ncbi:hypothetical protein BJ875DRAFT_485574 [Amylocarpus encephaloides]|uniref:NADH dehydrogenase [ubiquinone] 1 beta subcomplex subunit 2 n=1 Tax=Amylocarpus encephaloides TaxID=45428 RepID=A0A9P7YG07_9HELO|nr:hypothetical protein BJ875DRAFT_485574 [Amylocarpus encephaloides]
MAGPDAAGERPTLETMKGMMTERGYKGDPTAFFKKGFHRALPIYTAPRAYRYIGTGLSAAMWFFLMYRAKQDGAVLMGWKHPWDH